MTKVYTNIQLEDTIEMAAAKVYRVTDDVQVDIETFIGLAKLACSNMLIKTDKGYKRQVNGLEM